MLLSGVFLGTVFAGAAVRDRVSGAKAEGKPIQGSGIKLEPLWERQVVIPKEASEEQNEMHFRGNIFSLAPTLLVKVYPHKE